MIGTEGHELNRTKCQKLVQIVILSVLHISSNLLFISYKFVKGFLAIIFLLLVFSN